MSTGLHRFPLLAGLSERELRTLSERLEWLRVEPGTELFREGDPADGLLLVLEGRVQLWSERRKTSGEIGAGGAIGALSIVVEGAREATAETRSRCTLLRLSRESFRGLRAAAPDACCTLLEGLVRESAVFARDALAHLADLPANEGPQMAHLVDRSLASD